MHLDKGSKASLHQQKYTPLQKPECFYQWSMLQKHCWTSNWKQRNTEWSPPVKFSPVRIVYTLIWRYRRLFELTGGFHSYSRYVLRALRRSTGDGCWCLQAGATRPEYPSEAMRVNGELAPVAWCHPVVWGPDTITFETNIVATCRAGVCQIQSWPASSISRGWYPSIFSGSGGLTAMELEQDKVKRLLTWSCRNIRVSRRYWLKCKVVSTNILPFSEPLIRSFVETTIAPYMTIYVPQLKLCADLWLHSAMCRQLKLRHMSKRCAKVGLP